MCAPVFFTQPSTLTTRALTTQPVEQATTAATTTSSGAGNDLGGAGDGRASTDESSDNTVVFLILTIVCLIAAILLYVSIKTRGKTASTSAFSVYPCFRSRCAHLVPPRVPIGMHFRVDASLPGVLCPNREVAL